MHTQCTCLPLRLFCVSSALPLFPPPFFLVLPQAAACADAGAALISPFVGRILDWYKATYNRDYTPQEDPGVESVKRIYTYYKTHGYNTIVMAASFRNKGEITELAGCDKITISPQLLAELQASADPLPRKLSPDMTSSPDGKVSPFSSAVFDSLHGADQMAVDKLKQVMWVCRVCVGCVVGVCVWGGGDQEEEG